MRASGANAGLSFAQRSSIQRISPHTNFPNVFFLMLMASLRYGQMFNTPQMSALQTYKICSLVCRYQLYSFSVAQQFKSDPDCQLNFSRTQTTINTHTHGSTSPNERSAHRSCWLPTEHTTNRNVDTSVTSAGFEPAIPAMEWP